MEPNPNRLSSGSGEAVCGILFWAVVLSAAAAFWSELAAFWSLLLCAEAALLSAGAAPVELVADWSAEGAVGAAADWSLLGVVLVALLVLEADWSAEGVVLAEAEGVVLEAPDVADWSADGVEAEAEPAGVVAEAEAEGEALLEALWSLGLVFAPGAGAIAPPEPEAVESVVAVGAAPLSLLGGADCTGALLLVWAVEADWSELGMLLLAEAEGAAAPEGEVALLVVVVCVVVAPTAGAAAEAPVVLQDSEIIFTSATLNLLSEPIEPVSEAWCPTWASSPLPSSL
jgi:hypothetical protein